MCVPSISGLELQVRLKAQGNTMPIILVSGHSDIPIAVRAMKAGAMDFVTKPFDDQQLIEVVQKALQQHQLANSSMNLSHLAARYKLLNERERKVMQHVVMGKMNKVIAHEMDISIKTVELNRGRVMQKMQVESLADVVRYALQLNLPSGKP